MSLAKYRVPTNLVQEAENLAMGGFHLKVPAYAAEKRRKGRARWTEYAVIENAYYEEDAEKGHTNFLLITKILPDDSSVNVGATYRVTLRVNFASLENDPKDGQRMMSMGSIRKLKEIAAIAGAYEEGADLTGEILETLFPPQGSAEDMGASSPLVGCKVVMAMVDNNDPAKLFNGKNQQECEAFAAL